MPYFTQFTLVGAELRNLSRRFAAFAQANSQQIGRENYASVRQWQAKLSAYHQLFAAIDQQQFLEDEIRRAYEQLEFLRRDLSEMGVDGQTNLVAHVKSTQQ